VAISNELYYAILAMDAYNRGVTGGNSRELFVPNDIGGGHLGAATRLDQNATPLPTGYQNNGFFATDYDLNGVLVNPSRRTDPTTLNTALFRDMMAKAGA